MPFLAGPVVAGSSIWIAGVLALSVQLFLVPRGALREISQKYVVPFAPRGFLGRQRRYDNGVANESTWCGPRRMPVSAYRIWWLIWLLLIVAGVWLILLGSVDAFQAYARPNDQMVAGVLMALTWVCAAAWTPLYVQDRQWAFWAASAFLLLGAVLSITALIVLRPWSDYNAVTVVIIGLAYSIFSGWICVAATLSVCTAIISGKRGAVRDADSEEWLYGFIPVVVSGSLGLFQCILGDPCLTLPYLWALFFTPGLLKPFEQSWKLWLAAGICVLCSVVGGFVILAWQPAAIAAGTAAPPVPPLPPPSPP